MGENRGGGGGGTELKIKKKIEMMNDYKKLLKLFYSMKNIFHFNVQISIRLIECNQI